MKLGDEPYNTDLVVVSFGVSRQTLAFHAYGAPDFPGYLSISCSGLTKAINVDGTTGKTSVQ